jgi:hypothetical protein
MNIHLTPEKPWPRSLEGGGGCDTRRARSGVALLAHVQYLVDRDHEGGLARRFNMAFMEGERFEKTKRHLPLQACGCQMIASNTESMALNECSKWFCKCNSLAFLLYLSWRMRLSGNHFCIV